MSFCRECGAYIPVGETVCPACGYDPAKAAEAQQTQTQSYGGAQAQAQSYGSAQAQTQNSGYAAGAQQQSADSAKEPEQKQESWEPWKTPDIGHAGYQGQGGQSYQSASAGQSYQSQQTTSGGDPRRLSILSYLGPLFVIPLLLRKGDRFARFHANQGLVLWLFEMLTASLLGDSLLGAAAGVFAIYCLVRGAKSVAAGRMDRLPLIGNINLLR